MGPSNRTLIVMGVFAQFWVACLPQAFAQEDTTTADKNSQAMAVLERVSGREIENIHFDIQRQVQGPDWFEVKPTNGALNIRASSIVSGTYGAYQYLEDLGAMSVSWEGKRIALPSSYPASPVLRSRSDFSYRAYLNVCAYGYSTPWWDWERWQEEIDWMALHGVNNPVAMEGQEYVWKKLWQEFGLSDSEIDSYFSGPAFAPWQRMGNIEFHGGPLPDGWIEKKKVLQTKILRSMRSLGMEPVLPAFSGYVPKQFKLRHPQAKIYAMDPWSGFERETYWLDPADPLFKRIARRFIEIYSETYGAGSLYLSDAFNEMPPPVSESKKHKELTSYGKAIYDSIAEVVPGATWVLQGWMFGADKEFWDRDAVEAFLRKVPDGKAMVHDIGNDRYHVWEGADAFHGKGWVYGFIHNYGASNPVYGDFGYYREQVRGLLERDDTGNLSGFGVFPEGIENNSIVYEFLLDLPWQHQSGVSTEAWLERYLSARYGHLSDGLLPAWRELTRSVYQTRYWSPRWWEGSAGAYVLFKRPQLALTEFHQDVTSLAGLRRALELLLKDAGEYSGSELYLHDLVEFYRHYLTLEIDLLLQESIALYKAAKPDEGRALFDRVAELVTGLDRLLGVQPNTLSGWLGDAHAYGDNAEESSFYVRNAKLQIGAWGGDSLKDYASKAWQGMYRYYYLPRWQQFFDALDGGGALGSSDLEQQLSQWERDWADSDRVYPVQRPAKPLELMRSMLRDVDRLGSGARRHRELQVSSG